MGTIPAIQARKLYTQMIIAIFSDYRVPSSFFRSFFTEKVTATRYLNIAVQRSVELIAKDVVRGADGNRNTFSKDMFKTFEPAYFREYFDATELEVYDAMFSDGNDSIANGTFERFVQTVADKMILLRDKIDRAIEKQCTQVMETGIVTMASGDQIDYKRKANSKILSTAIPNVGGYWDAQVDVFAQIEYMIRSILKHEGKSEANVFNMTLGYQAFNALLNNSVFKARQDYTNLKLDNITTPVKNAAGAFYHGEISCGSYPVRIWVNENTYEEISNGSTTTTYFMDQKKAVITPESQTEKFVLGFAAVPQLITGQQSVRKGKYIMADHPDEKKSSHEFEVKSCPLAIPVAVDQIATLRVLA